MLSRYQYHHTACAHRWRPWSRRGRQGTRMTHPPSVPPVWLQPSG